MKSYRLSELSQPELDGLKARPRIDFSSIFSVVSNFSSSCNVLFLCWILHVMFFFIGILHVMLLSHILTLRD